MANQQLPEGTDTITGGADAEPDPYTAGTDPDEAAAAKPATGIFDKDESAKADTSGRDRASGKAGASADDGPKSSGGRDGGPNARGNAGDGGGAFFERIDQLKSQGYDSARAYAVSGKDRATGAMDELIRTINDAAAQIDAKVGTNYGDYARRAADGIGGFNDLLKGKDVDELFNEARTMVAKAPAVAVGTAAALGFLVARLARAGLSEAELGKEKPKA